MREILFDGRQEVSVSEFLEKINYYVETAAQAQDIHKSKPKECLEISKVLRSQLEREYKNNSLRRIKDTYNDSRLFNNYSSAVHEALASTLGKLTLNNVYSFLYDVDYYMRYYTPSEHK